MKLKTNASRYQTETFFLYLTENNPLAKFRTNKAIFEYSFIHSYPNVKSL